MKKILMLVIFLVPLVMKVQAQGPVRYHDRDSLNAAQQTFMVSFGQKFENVYTRFSNLASGDSIRVDGLTEPRMSDGNIIAQDTIPMYMINYRTPTVQYTGLVTGISTAGARNPFVVTYYANDIFYLLFTAVNTLAKTIKIENSGINYLK